MKTIELTKKEIDSLPDYSYATPNFLSKGRRWKRSTSSGWIMGEIVIKTKEQTIIEWSQIKEKK